VTLIVGLKCTDGYAVCSDSQETAGTRNQYRVDRKKLVPKRCGNFDIALAGSGNNGDLIDSCTQRLHDNIATANIQTLPELKKFIERELLDFRKNEASDYSRHDRDMAFIIAARSVDPLACTAWISSASRLTEITEYAITGHEDYRYEYLLANLYRNDLTLTQGVFLGLHVMGIAEQTSNCIKAPVTVVTVKAGRLHEETQATIDQLVLRVKLFAAQTESMMLACADTGLGVQEFSAKFKEFVSTVALFRKEYLSAVIGEKIEQGLDTVNDDYNLIPPGTEIVHYPTKEQAEAIQKMQENITKQAREQDSGQQDYRRILANLATVKACSQTEAAQRAGGIAVDVSLREAAGVAMNELLQAMLMGPYKITAQAAIAIARLFEFLNARFDLGFGEEENQRLRMMALDQAIAVIESEFNSQNQAPSPTNPAQS
jgi:hypothetical protein